MKKKFEEKRKYHYNEYSKVKLARKLIEQELKDLEDDDDDTDSKKEQPSSSQTDADTQVRWLNINVDKTLWEEAFAAGGGGVGVGGCIHFVSSFLGKRRKQKMFGNKGREFVFCC